MVGKTSSILRFLSQNWTNHLLTNGKTYVSRTSSKERAGHFDISRGAQQVDYAGSIRFGWSDGTRGVLKEFDNSSGHYKPKTENAHQSGLPLDKFKEHPNAK